MIDINIKFPVADEIRDELKRIGDVLEKLVVVLTPPTAARIVFFVEEGGTMRRAGPNMFQKVNEAKKFAIKITDKFGNDAKVDGAPAWAVTDEALATIVVAEDGMSAVVTPVGPVGSLKVQVSADADLGEGVKPLLGELDLDLVAGDAEVLSIGEVPLE